MSVALVYQGRPSQRVATTINIFEDGISKSSDLARSMLDTFCSSGTGMSESDLLKGGGDLSLMPPRAEAKIGPKALNIFVMASEIEGGGAKMFPGTTTS